MQKASHSVLCYHTSPIRSHRNAFRNKSHNPNDRDGMGEDLSHMGSHDIHLVKRFRTVWAFSHAVGNAVLNTIVAEEMPTSLQDSVLEILSTNGTERKSLDVLAWLYKS